MMPPPDFIARFTEHLSAALPESLGSLRDDIHTHIKRALSKTLSHFELVSREEFDAQTKVLERTKAQLAALETQITELENKLK